MSTLMLGFGRADISPDGNVSMNSTQVGTYLFDPLYASCIAWQEDDLTFLQYSIDLRSLYDVPYSLFSAAVTEATGIPDDRIILSVTHNHSSPDVALLARPENKDWFERFGLPGFQKAGVDALADLSPVTGAEGGKTTTSGVTSVRRYFRENGLMAGVAAPKSDSPIARHESDADPELRAVRIFREGKKDLILVNFQVHAASCLGQFPGRICADIVGPIREALEADGTAYAVYLQGACGNTNSSTRVPAEKADWPENYHKSGQLIGQYALEALKKAKPLALGKLKYVRDEMTCTVNHAKTHLAEKAMAIREETDPDKKQQMMVEAGITSRYEVSSIIKRATYGATRQMPLAALVCGELAMGFAPVELFDACGRNFRDVSPCEMTFFCGYSLGYHSYMPSAPTYPNGGYEALQCHYVPGTGEMIALELARHVHRMKKD